MYTLRQAKTEWETANPEMVTKPCEEKLPSWLAFIQNLLETGKITQDQYDRLPKGKCK